MAGTIHVALALPCDRAVSRTNVGMRESRCMTAWPLVILNEVMSMCTLPTHERMIRFEGGARCGVLRGNRYRVVLP